MNPVILVDLLFSAGYRMINMELTNEGFHLVFVLLITIRTVNAHVTDTSFDVVEPGQIIGGKIGAERIARKNIECSSM